MINAKHDDLETAIEDQIHVSEDLTAAEDSLNHRVSALEEEVTCLKNINNELRVAFNDVVNELNCIVAYLNGEYNIEN